MLFRLPEMSTHGLDLPCSFPGGKDPAFRRPTVMEPKTHKREKQPVEEVDEEEDEECIPISKKSKGEEEIEHGEEGGGELVSLLVDCLEAMGLKDISGMDNSLEKLGDLASPKGTSLCRVASYFVEGLALRMVTTWPNNFTIIEPRKQSDEGIAFRLLNEATPVVKFLHFTSNEILVREMEGEKQIHILDLDIKEGLQWPGFFHSMATRCHPPDHLRITGVGISKKELNETGERLSHFAESMGLAFDFQPLVERVEDLRPWMVNQKEGETMGVSCLLQLHRVVHNRGVMRGVLGAIGSMNPKVVVLGEQEGWHNGGSLEGRVCRSLRYYSSIFDMLEWAFGGGGEEGGKWRRVVEEGVFGREIRNMVGFEGGERYERHEEFEEWRRIMVGGGFRCVKIEEREIVQSEMLLRMYDELEGFFHVEKIDGGGGEGECGGECLTLRWMDQRLFSLSAWSPLQVAGCSPSSPPPTFQVALKD